MTAQPANRLIFLDAMRGFTIAAMILVNFPGNEEYVFSPLRHTVWNGLTPTDLIAPFFLFIVGISIVLSYGKRLEKGDSKGDLYKKIFWRFVKIYALGIFLNLLPDFNFSELRYTGVLPRIALVFLPCAIIFLNTSFRQQVWIGVLILVAYWLAMTLIPTPGAGKVMLEPGTNLAAWIDSKYLPGHMWQGTWDPEGILSTFPAIVTGITGLLAGHLLISKRIPTDKVIYLMIFGLITAVAGYVWGLTFPVNENLWTSSFVLVTSGMAAMILGATYYVVDIRGFAGWVNPGIIFGANAIGVYVLADLLALIFYVFPIGSATLNIRLTEAMTNFGLDPMLSSCCYALFFVCINFIPAYFLYKKKIFIKV
ncbi:MAG TPA: heparan-alpha-glucosaminide N-acetyltransferase domain-containing protein [Cyclobacteriaceae bacterium]|nr:heparan-alpha-glucosaminide N-acetyltransferase domain-containing protein [Cyclobacteriaceae bacterium]